jgi:hypothetical protein
MENLEIHAGSHLRPAFGIRRSMTVGAPESADNRPFSVPGSDID